MKNQTILGVIVILILISGVAGYSLGSHNSTKNVTATLNTNNTTANNTTNNNITNNNTTKTPSNTTPQHTNQQSTHHQSTHHSSQSSSNSYYDPYFNSEVKDGVIQTGQCEGLTPAKGHQIINDIS